MHQPWRRFSLFAGIALGLLGVSCAPGQYAARRYEQQARSRPLPGEVSRQESSDGSLWPGHAGRTFLFGDEKASSIGDIVTVRVTESASASKNANTTTKRDSSTKVEVGTLFGIESSLNGGNSSLVDASQVNDFTGSGQTTRQGNLTAIVASTIVDLMPNGNFFIEGRKKIIVNNEAQYIILSGEIRPQDVAPDNSILSTQMANSEIVYTGAGVIGDKQRPGWASRILDQIWPF